MRLAMLFFSYSFLGWCIEVTLKFIQYHRFINRGFLTGPICPIYGSGATLITLAVEELAQVESGIGTTFALSFLICGAVEYFTSYYMEKRFHARWWDYSQKPMNLHGRIWIGNLVLFGLGGIAIIHLVNPMLDQVLELFSLKVKEIASACLLTVTAADYTMTHFVLKLVKTGLRAAKRIILRRLTRRSICCFRTGIYSTAGSRTLILRSFTARSGLTPDWLRSGRKRRGSGKLPNTA